MRPFAHRPALVELGSSYVVLNPVRAGMVGHAGSWRWSSYGALVDDAPAPDWLDVDALLSRFAERRHVAIRRYVNHVRAGVGLPSILSSLKQQMYLGDDAFVTRMQRKAGASAEALEVPRARRRAPAKPLAHYVALKLLRERAMARAYATGHYTLADMAKAFGVHYCTVSRAVGRSEAASESSGQETRRTQHA